MSAAAFLIAAALIPAAVQAQAPACRIPDRLPRPSASEPTQAQPRRLMPIEGYTLALSWSPEYCRRRADSPKDRFQCGGDAGRFGFVLHGLWPEGKSGRWPQYCRPVASLPDPVLRRHLCDMPSVDMIQHEWAKHGSCVSADPARYLAAATRMYRAVRYPDMDALSRRELTVGEFARAFAAANRGLSPEMVLVDANARGWLEEVHLCLGRNLRPAACKVTGSAPGKPLRIWRGGR